MESRSDWFENRYRVQARALSYLRTYATTKTIVKKILFGEKLGKDMIFIEPDKERRNYTGCYVTVITHQHPRFLDVKVRQVRALFFEPAVLNSTPPSFADT